MTRITAFAGLLCLCLVIVAGAADRVGNARLFPFPLVEAERMITRWFAASSFQTAVAETGGGDKQVRAQKAAEEWKIVLKPSSPLNTEVSARCSVAGVEDAVRLETFWAALDRYAKGSQQVKGNPARRHQLGTGQPRRRCSGIRKRRSAWRMLREPATSSFPDSYVMIQD